MLKRNPRSRTEEEAIIDVQPFVDAEMDYLDWIARNETGWVVNSLRLPTPRYLILHRADCWTIGTRGRGAYTTGDYIKVCSMRRSALESWAADEVLGKLMPCGLCLSRVDKQT